MLEFVILILFGYWLLSFLGQPVFPGIAHTGRFIYILSVVIFMLITMKFLSWM